MQTIQNNLIQNVLISASLGASLFCVQAGDVYVTSYQGTNASVDITPCPPSCPTGSVSSLGSPAYSTILSHPVRRSRYGFDTNASWSVTPALGNSASVYKVYVTLPSIPNASPDLTVIATATNATWSSPNAEGEIQVDAFRSSNPANIWLFVGYLTNSSATPTITFRYGSGVISSTQRWYMDAVRFEGFCCCPFVPPLDTAQPIAAGQTSVTVTGLITGTTNVNVYADGLLIGSNNNATGFAAGSMQITTTPLVTGTAITANQAKDGCFSLLPSSGALVRSLAVVTPYQGVTALWGRPVSLSVEAVGAEPIFYHWQKENLPINSATNATYTLTPVQIGDAGQYSVVVSNASMALTNTGRLLIKPADIRIDLEPNNVPALQIAGVSGYNYRIQSTSDVTDTNAWTTITNLTLPAAVYSWTNSAEGNLNGHRFYRILPGP